MNLVEASRTISGWPAFLALESHLLGEAPADLVEHEPHGRSRPIEVRRWDHEVEAYGIAGMDQVGDPESEAEVLLATMGSRSRAMRSAIVFFSLIGGLGALGAIGLVIGPLVVALFLALVPIHLRDFRTQPGAGA